MGMKDGEHISPQAAMGLLAELSALEKMKNPTDEKRIILPYSEYQKMLEAIQKKEERRQEIYNQCQQDIECLIGQSIESIISPLRLYNAHDVSEYVDKRIKNAVAGYKRQYDNIYDEYKKLRITLEQMKEEQENKDKRKWWQIWKR